MRRPLALAEKILYAHLAKPEQELERGKSHLSLLPKVLIIQLDTYVREKAHTTFLGL